MTDKEKKIIDRQDLVDNAIFEMLKMVTQEFRDSKTMVTCSPDNSLGWDTELIGRVRDEVQKILVDEFPIGCTAGEFYPAMDD